MSWLIASFEIAAAKHERRGRENYRDVADSVERGHRHKGGPWRLSMSRGRNEAIVRKVGQQIVERSEQPTRCRASH